MEDLELMKLTVGGFANLAKKSMECIFLFSMFDMGGLALCYFIRCLFILGRGNSVSLKKG